VVFVGLLGAGKGGVVSSASPDFSDDFNRADSGTVGGTIWASETDASSKLSIVSNQLSYSADTSGTTGYVTLNVSSAIVTVKFKMAISAITGVASGVCTYSPCRIYNAGAASPLAMLNINGNADIFNYGAVRGNFAESASTVNFTSPSLGAGTQYDCYLLVVNSATVGGAACKIGTWAESSTGFNDDTSALGNAAIIRFGGVSNQFGSGANDPTITFDDFQVYYSDAR
jgi:hypothetical protein